MSSGEPGSGRPAVDDGGTTGDLAPVSTRPLTVLVGGGVFLTSGAALVVHVLTGAPVPLVLALLVVLGGSAWGLLTHADPLARRRWTRRVGAGLVAGLMGTAAYDGSRWLLVQLAGWQGSPFAAFGLFGDAVLGESDGPWRLVAGVSLHVLNGLAFGVAYVVWLGHRSWWWGIVFALGLEAFMLAIYPGWLNPESMAEFTQMSVLGHLAYGTVLGLVGTRLTRRWDPGGVRPPQKRSSS